MEPYYKGIWTENEYGQDSLTFKYYIQYAE
jgi:hypothetical protein